MEGRLVGGDDATGARQYYGQEDGGHRRHELMHGTCAVDRQPSEAPPVQHVSAVVTPSTVVYASATVTPSRRSGVRARQQLAPRNLIYNDDDDALPPSTRPRVDTAAQSGSATTVDPIHPTPSQPMYAVARGRRVGVYRTIEEVHKETRDYEYNVYRLCASKQEAERFIDRYLDVTQGKRGDPDPRHRSTLVAFCDGATQGKPNWSHQTGFACIFPHNSTWDVVYTCDDAYCTAYRATAKAALQAVLRANAESPSQDQVLYIYTRNQLLVRAMTEWMEKWRQNDWRKGDGYPVKNRDVLQRIVEAQGARRVIWRLEDHWASEWAASSVSAAEDAAIDVDVDHSLYDVHW